MMRRSGAGIILPLIEGLPPENDYTVCTKEGVFAPIMRDVIGIGYGATLHILIALYQSVMKQRR